MAINGLPEGWSYEGPDRSVGIFGEAFIHEFCVQEGYTEHEYGDEQVTITCQCGEVLVLEDPAPDYEPDPMDDIPWGTPDSWIPDNPDENGMRQSDFI